jgi:hypothetical protein
MKLLKIRNQQFELLMSIDSILSHVYALATTIVGCPFATMTTPTSLARIPVNQARNLFNQARYPVVMTGAMVIRVPFQWNVNPAPIVKAMGVIKGPGRGETIRCQGYFMQAITVQKTESLLVSEIPDMTHSICP